MLHHCRAKFQHHFVALRYTPAIFCILSYANQTRVLKPFYEFIYVIYNSVPEDCTNERSCGRSRWPCDLRRRSSDPRLLRLRVRIPSMAWMFLCAVCLADSLTRWSLVQSNPTECAYVYVCVWLCACVWVSVCLIVCVCVWLCACVWVSVCV